MNREKQQRAPFVEALEALLSAEDEGLPHAGP